MGPRPNSGVSRSPGRQNPFWLFPLNLVDIVDMVKNRERPKILVADDDETVLRLLCSHLSKGGFEPIPAEDGAEAIALADDSFSAALIDLEMPHVNGRECLKHLRKEHSEIAVVVLSATGGIEDAVNALKSGAVDYLTKPFDPSEVIAVLRQAVKVTNLGKEVKVLKQAVGDSRPRSPFLATSPIMRELLDNAETVAALPSTLMITGESGVGKSLLSRHIHYCSPRAGKPFVCVSCPALPRELLESELFGHEKGSFTGAHQQRLGKFELAQGGTLFLDEIGDLPLDLQPKLLNVLQDREIFRIGGTKPVNIDVRVIAATNIDLEEKVRSGDFREDLFYRLNVIPLELPPLRARPEDIKTIALHVLERISKDRGLDKPIKLDKEAMAVVSKAAWPGNVRQLENALERAAAFSKDGVIKASALKVDTATSKSGSPEDVPDLNGFDLRALERMALEQTLAACDNNRAKTARRLGITEKSVYNKLKRMALES